MNWIKDAILCLTQGIARIEEIVSNKFRDLEDKINNPVQPNRGSCQNCEKISEKTSHVKVEIGTQTKRKAKIKEVPSFRNRCPDCKKEFTSEINLKDHIKQIHKKTLTYTCKVCNAIYKSREGMRKHLKRCIQKVMKLL